MYTIYTDGSCLKNPGKGGWAFVILSDDKLTQKSEETLISGGSQFTTNNKMEMTAIINSLKYMITNKKTNEKITLYTDSNYVVKGLTVWLANWKKNDWKTSNKTPVKNKELWIELDELRTEFKELAIKWIKAHDVSYYNNLVDKQARFEALQL